MIDDLIISGDESGLNSLIHRMINKDRLIFFIAQAQCLHGLFQSTLHLVECTSYSAAAIPHTWRRPFFVRSLRIASLFLSTASEVSNRMPQSFAFSDGNKNVTGSKIGVVRQMRYTGNVKFSQKLHDLICDIRPCVVMMKSPSSLKKLWSFLSNVLLQFSRHWRVVHLHQFHFVACKKLVTSTT